MAKKTGKKPPEQEKTTIKIAELVIKAIVAAAAMIEAIRWW